MGRTAGASERDVRTTKEPLLAAGILPVEETAVLPALHERESTMAWYEDYVTRVDGVQGGAPILRGTRTPVGTVVAYSQTYEGNLAEVQRALRHLNETQIHAALAYYEAHRAEVDADEERHKQALAALFAAR